MPTCAWEDFFTIDYMLHSCGAAQKTTEAKVFTRVPTLILHSFIYFVLMSFLVIRVIHQSRFYT